MLIDEKGETCNFILMSPVELLVVECGVVDDNNFSNEVDNPFGIVKKFDGMIFVKSLNSKDEVQFQFDRWFHIPIVTPPFVESRLEEALDAFVFEP